MTQREQVGVAGRLFCVVAVLLDALVSGDGGLVAPVLVVVVGALATYLTRRGAGTSLPVLAGESLAVALVVGLGFPHGSVAMPYLVLVCLLAGLFTQLPGVLLVVAVQLVGVVALPLLTQGPVHLDQRLGMLSPWLLTSLGVGLLGRWAPSLGQQDVSAESDTHYESARQLLTQLRAVARRLSAGLDSDGISAQLMESVHDGLADSYTAVFVRAHGSILVPFGFRGEGASAVLDVADPIVDRCWTLMLPVQGVVPSGNRRARHRTALPLRVGTRMIGVVVSSAEEPAESVVMDSLMREVDGHSLRLDTALVFDEIRTMATADERQRLAREIHDGIAQEVASLGYVVDHMAATSRDPAVTEGLHELRAELSRIVADLRLSIFDLRSDVSPTNGLGSALSDYVRQVGAKSDLTVHLTLNEAPTRLPPAVEAELLRIAQEAITNARKHASAQNLWVDCWTAPPLARLVVRDDGTGMSGRRDDSYGISIMRERAERIDATLDIWSGSEPDSPPGTVVQVSVAAQERVPHEGLLAP